MSITVTPKEDGQIAFEAYSAHTHGRSLATGDQLPQWKDLPEEVKDAWRTAGSFLRQHIAQQVLENHIK